MEKECQDGLVFHITWPLFNYGFQNKVRQVSNSIMQSREAWIYKLMVVSETNQHQILNFMVSLVELQEEDDWKRKLSFY